jgi:hypothetical protein
MGTVAVTQAAYGNIPQNFGTWYAIGGLTVTMSSSYATGGDTITPQQIGFGATIINMHVTVNTAANVGPFWLFMLNTVTPGTYTIQAFGLAAGATGLTEAGANTAGINSFVFGATFIGI